MVYPNSLVFVYEIGHLVTPSAYVTEYMGSSVPVLLLLVSFLFSQYCNHYLLQTFSKTNKGRVKKSIFATPDGDKGKVGVGTCGVGGKPMTAFQHQEKWKK